MNHMRFRDLIVRCATFVVALAVAPAHAQYDEIDSELLFQGQIVVKAASDAAYKLWLEQQAAEAAADEQREKEEAQRRKMAQIARLVDERRREEECARQAQAALDRAAAVVQA